MPGTFLDCWSLVPIYGSHTNLIVFPSPEKDGKVMIEPVRNFNIEHFLYLQDDVSKFTLLTKEMKPLHFTGSCVAVPFQPGHHYVLPQDELQY